MGWFLGRCELGVGTCELGGVLAGVWGWVSAFGDTCVMHGLGSFGFLVCGHTWRYFLALVRVYA